MAFTILTADDLSRAHGGVTMQLTQYGYPKDPYMDKYTRRGLGKYHNLVRDESVALTDSSLTALGLSRAMIGADHPWVNIKLRGGGVLHRRIDDRAPERGHRADLYMPGGYDSGLGDDADISLADGYTPHAIQARSPHHTARRHHR